MMFVVLLWLFVMIIKINDELLLLYYDYCHENYDTLYGFRPYLVSEICNFSFICYLRAIQNSKWFELWSSLTVVHKQTQIRTYGHNFQLLWHWCDMSQRSTRLHS